MRFASARPARRRTVSARATSACGERTETVEWLGRLHEQVSVSGQRVDLWAVERALAAHPHVREALVKPRPGETNAELTAWFRSDGAPAALVSPEQLRAFLRERLPEEWLPTAYVRVEAFPVTAAGCLDDARLPAPTDNLAIRTGCRGGRTLPDAALPAH